MTVFPLTLGVLKSQWHLLGKRHSQGLRFPSVNSDVLLWDSFSSSHQCPRLLPSRRPGSEDPEGFFMPETHLGYHPRGLQSIPIPSSATPTPTAYGALSSIPFPLTGVVLTKESEGGHSSFPKGLESLLANREFCDVLRVG